MNELRPHLQALIAHRANPSVSLYMPVETAGREVQKNPIRLKNLLKEAKALLGADGGDLITPLDKLAPDDALWREHAPGLAIFHSRRGTGFYPLPTKVESFVTVEDRFHLKPILRVLGEPSRFYILALSQNATRLLAVDRWGMERISTDAIPASLADSMPRVDGEKQLQYHSGPGGSSVYHGQGAGEHRADEDLRRFLAAVGSGLDKALRSKRGPIVLAGVTELTTQFRALNQHKNLVGQDVEGNVDPLSDEELQRRAQPLAAPHLREGRDRANTRVSDLNHTDLVTSSVETILGAAIDGRVDTLFVEAGTRQWGRFDPANRVLTVEPSQTKNNEDLLDLAAIGTFERGGDVFIVDATQMPLSDTPATAILRY